MKKHLFFVIAIFTVAGNFSSAFAAHFNNPKWNGYALDWCAGFERSCGKPAADQWCQRKGYGPSTNFQQLPQVSFETMTIGDNAVCTPSHHRCDSFSFIDCQETARLFTKPMYNGYRLDWCLSFENQCGAPAALAYCQKSGFSKVLGFSRWAHQDGQTMTIGSNAVCNPAFHVCDSFLFIRCGN